MKRNRFALATGLCLAAATVAIAWVRIAEDDAAPVPAPAPVISVHLVRPLHTPLQVHAPATGSVAAWEEASIGAEANGLRLTDVKVNVGDTVQRGQLLASFNPGLIEAELGEAAAAVALAAAESSQAAANLQRAQVLDASGAIARQQLNQYQATALTTRARLDSARAVVQRARLRLLQTRVLAPSDGIISARTATVGAVVPAGQELFRLIRDGRLEWRAVVASADLLAMRPGQTVNISIPGAGSLEGRVRALGPVIDVATRSGLVYVDLPAGAPLRAGAFVQGYIAVGEEGMFTLPQAAVLLRDGFNYVMQVGQDGRVLTRRVEVGRRSADRVEVVSGLEPSDAVVASGLGFLNDGDFVRVISVPASGKASQS
ncbi:efflux RND transporter periplasmic adaptor subunit [Stenotrophomonas forensis]|uniref:efflux RND transporter periplasmic adaptor subunit n=1 Tax=Stenotrophomonas forensis TaxID=2871169 RepID=UPI0039C75AB6